eukprot:CAMPEP_0178983360 /NCGR_PEP_ID=MMETSP0795-20121207/1017_1 /TAXON_ID=88552 /ORGANISM="Amoebophrya sp., Strain Ameob2" /LENGTH=1178 /DNA_ID=CAMNT_0020674125 /DNA_START=267 /DNA_END=3805 /DNA_ORIENTATION=+
MTTKMRTARTILSLALQEVVAIARRPAYDSTAPSGLAGAGSLPPSQKNSKLPYTSSGTMERELSPGRATESSALGAPLAVTGGGNYNYMGTFATTSDQARASGAEMSPLGSMIGMQGQMISSYNYPGGGDDAAWTEVGDGDYMLQMQELEATKSARPWRMASAAEATAYNSFAAQSGVRTSAYGYDDDELESENDEIQDEFGDIIIHGDAVRSFAPGRESAALGYLKSVKGGMGLMSGFGGGAGNPVFGNNANDAKDRGKLQKMYQYPGNENKKQPAAAAGNFVSMVPQHQAEYIIRHRKPAYDPKVTVPGLSAEMFRNVLPGIEHDKMRNEGHSTLKKWIYNGGASGGAEGQALLTKQEETRLLQSLPEMLFIDALDSKYQKRCTGRYSLCPKLHNNSPFWYSRMSRLYLYNVGGDGSSSSEPPQYVVGRSVGSYSFVMCLEGNLSLASKNQKTGQIQGLKVFSYDKFSDPDHVRGKIRESLVVGESNLQRRSDLKVMLNTMQNTAFERRTTERIHDSQLSVEAFLPEPRVKILACAVPQELEELKLQAGKNNKTAADQLVLQYDILKKEFYLAKHSAILVFKKLGQPTSVVGLYLPLIEEYEDIFPSETRQIFKREKQQQQNRAKGAAGDRQAQQLADQEDYLQFPKYYCCESGLYMFFNPKKGQWKIIGTPIMHQPHAVKACSETGVKVMFPPLAPWQQHFEPMIQFPALDGTLIDKQLLKQGVQPFVDPEFPPNRKSLAERGASSGQVVQGEVEWFRARDIHDTDFPMKLYDRIEPSDCIQGGLGDCWLLAALAVVAEYPDFVPTQCFHEKECQMNGKYRINLFDYSKSPPAWRTITIDDFIPCYPKSPFAETPIPRFSQPNGNEAWFLLLEKAFAKFAGGYMNLKAGYAGLAWIALTGCLDYGRWIREKDERNPPPVGGPKDVGKATEQSVKQVKFRRRPIASFHPSGNRLGFEYTDYQASDVVYAGEAMIGYLRQCERNNYPVCAVGVHGTGMEHKRDDGLIDGHAYSVLQILDVNCLDGKTRTLVKLRNPWGDFHEWEGPFGDDHAASWKLVADNGKGIRNTELDGIFWMEAPAFLSYFTHVEAVHYDLKRRKPGPPMADGAGGGGVAAGMIAGTGGTVVNRGLDPKQAQRRDNWQKERAQDDRTLSMKFHKPGSGANKAPEGKRKAAKSK